MGRQATPSVGQCNPGSGETLEAINKYLSDKKIAADVIEVGCIGMCSAEPIVDIQLPGKSRLSFRQITAEKVEGLLSATLKKLPPAEDVIGQHKTPGTEAWANLPLLDDHPWYALQKRHILARCGIISPLSITDYLADGGFKAFYKTVLNYTADKVCDIVEQSGLQGRGGGGFLTGKKWQIALTTGSDQKYLICNADESDPGSFMDRAVIEGDPYLLIEGIAIAAYAIGASNAFVYLKSDYRKPISILEQALQQAREYGFLGENIFGSGFQRNFIPSFSWGGTQGLTTFRFEKAVEVASAMYLRRNLIFDETETELLEQVFEMTKKYRQG